MILTKQDIEDFIEEYSDYQLEYGKLNSLSRERSIESEKTLLRFYNWLTENPQVLVATQFQEYVGAHSLPLYRNLVEKGTLINSSRPIFRKYEGQWILISDITSYSNKNWDGYSLETLKMLAECESGTEREDKLLDETVPLLAVDEIIQKAYKIADSGLLDATLFVSPKLWTPYSQNMQKDFLRDATLKIIKEIQLGKMELKSIRWQTFEEIVAEVLRASGMEIYLVKDTPQGGRDIIARTELIPGTEPLTIAVEVKHTEFADRPLLQQALYQNRHFPALMFVTSGRFTAGVLREVESPLNKMRLFLKDGIAIRELIQRYRI